MNDATKGKYTKAVTFRIGQLKLMLTLDSLLILTHLISFGYAMGYLRTTSSGDTFTVSGEDFQWSLRAGITIGLIVCAVGLTLRTLRGIVIAIAGLAWMFFMCWKWQRTSNAFLKARDVTSFSSFSKVDVPNTAGLLMANWLDVAVIVTAGVLLIWLVVFLARVLREAQHYTV